MEPTQRKLKILEAVVEAFIKTGEPVGSKALCENLDFNVSSATIRNDMAELASLGLLEQTHTSSGRIPTELGYRIYVDKLMKRIPLTKYEQSRIYDILYPASDAPEHLLEGAAALLSKITGCVAVATSPPGEAAIIKKIRFIQTGRYTAMAVLITSTGSVKTKLFRCDFVITPELTEMFEKTMNERFSGVSVTDVTPAFMQSSAAALGEMSILMTNVLLAVNDAARDASAASAAVRGQSNFFTMPELASGDGKRVMELLSHSRELERMLTGADSKASVLIGSEIKHPALSSLSVIASHYKSTPECSGVLALIGPVRMDYPKIISALEYTSDIVGNMLSELIEYG